MPENFITKMMATNQNSPITSSSLLKDKIFGPRLPVANFAPTGMPGIISNHAIIEQLFRGANADSLFRAMGPISTHPAFYTSANQNMPTTSPTTNKPINQFDPYYQQINQQIKQQKLDTLRANTRIIEGGSPQTGRALRGIGAGSLLKVIPGGATGGSFGGPNKNKF